MSEPWRRVRTIPRDRKAPFFPPSLNLKRASQRKWRILIRILHEWADRQTEPGLSFCLVCPVRCQRINRDSADFSCSKDRFEPASTLHPGSSCGDRGHGHCVPGTPQCCDRGCSGGVWQREEWGQARERSGVITTFTVLRTILRAFPGSTFR